MSSYRILFDLSQETLIARTKCYRSLVIVISIACLCSFLFSLFTWSLKPLSSMLLVITAWNAFLFCDTSKLNKWRHQLINAWKSQAIELDILQQTLLANEKLPKRTLQGMFDTLPSIDVLKKERSISNETREVIALTVVTRDKLLRIRLLYTVTLTAIIALVILIAIHLTTWLPLLLLLTLPVMWLFFKSIKQKTLTEMQSDIDDISQVQTIDRKLLNKIISQIDWSGLPKNTKNYFMYKLD